MQKEIEINIGPIGVVRGLIELPDNKGQSSFPVVVFVTGYGGKGSKSNTWTALQAPINKCGIATALFDFIGQGNSSGDIKDLCIFNGVEQLRQVIEKVKEVQEVNSERIGLLGSSYGGYISLIYTALYGGIKVLGLKSPVSDYAEVREMQIGHRGIIKWRSNNEMMVEDTLSNYRFYVESKSIDIYGRLASDIDSNCLIVHGDSDTNVPLSQSEKLVEMIKNANLNIVHGANHGYKEGDSFNIMRNAFVEWFSNQL